MTSSNRHSVTISPDGTHLVYIANNRLFLRSLDEFEANVLPRADGEGSINTPVFSPDGRSIAFQSLGDNTIKRVAVSGGAPVSVCPALALLGMTWDPSAIVFGMGAGGIVRCSPNGGAPEQLAKVAEGESAEGPQLLLDGAVLLFTIAKTADLERWSSKAQIVTQTMKTGVRKTLVNGGTDARYLPSGHLVYALGGIVFAVPFNPARQELMGGAVPVVEGVRGPAAARTTGSSQFAISRTGTLVYVPGPTGTTTGERALAVADRTGTLTRLAVPSGPYVNVRASSDGARLAIGVDSGTEASVSIQEMRGTKRDAATHVWREGPVSDLVA